MLNKIEVGGEGSWDYLFDDADAHRLYVSHAAKVVVIDTDTEFANINLISLSSSEFPDGIRCNKPRPRVEFFQNSKARRLPDQRRRAFQMPTNV